MTTLQNSYCRVDIVRQWRDISGFDADESSLPMLCYNICKGNNVLVNFIPKRVNRPNEITADKFADLIHDRIAPWRLEEIGFEKLNVPAHLMPYMMKVGCHNVFFDVKLQSVILDTKPICITTFTDLLTLIKFLTPPTK